MRPSASGFLLFEGSTFNRSRDRDFNVSETEGKTMISQDETATFRTSLRGASFVPDEPGYDAARVVFNRVIDRHPAIIARCAGAADVITCVNFAREYRLPISVRAGGHSIAGKAICDDGLMIDLSAMKGIRVDT